MKALRLFLVLPLLAPVLVYAWPWSQDMMNQPSTKPQEPESNGQLSPFPQRSVPVQGIPTQTASREEAQNLTSPIPPDEASIKEGRVLFRIVCAACHGQTGKADSPVTDKIGAIDLTSDYVQKDLTEGWIYGTITHGGAVMPPYGVAAGGVGSNDLSVEERWHVVNYVRHALTKEAAVAAPQAAAQ